MSSPIPQQTMDFPTAIREVGYGRRVTRLDWHNPDIFIFLSGGIVCINKSDGVHHLILSDGDLFGKDWVTCDLNG